MFAKIRGDGAWMSAECLKKGPVPLPPGAEAPSVAVRGTAALSLLHADPVQGCWAAPACPEPPPSHSVLYLNVFRFPPPKQAACPQVPFPVGSSSADVTHVFWL